VLAKIVKLQYSIFNELSSSLTQLDRASNISPRKFKTRDKKLTRQLSVSSYSQ